VITVAKLLTAAETAAALRQVLGPARQWRDFLADCIRGRTALHGYVLMPHAAREGGRNEVPRPLYRPADVAEFIKAVRAADPSLKPAPIKADTFRTDDTPGLPWRMRLAKPERGASL
jgi:hypothetical protein